MLKYHTQNKVDAIGAQMSNRGVFVLVFVEAIIYTDQKHSTGKKYCSNYHHHHSEDDKAGKISQENKEA